VNAPYYEDDLVTLYHGRWEDVLPSLPDLSVDMILTDPPYNCVNRQSGGLRSLDKGGADSEPVVIEDLVGELVRLATGSLYVFCGDVQMSDFLREFKTHGLTVRGATWHKTNPSVMNGDKLWLSAAEFCAFARKPKAYFSLSCQANVWRHKTDSEVDWHPTPKPLPLMEHLVRASCPPGGVVLDPFAGSGTSLLAAKNCNVRAIGVELNDAYCARMVARLGQDTLFGGVA
jgi:DNA modification methylase